MSKVILKNVRLSFPSLFETEVYNGEDTGKYTATFLLDKKEHADTIAEIKSQMIKLAEEKFGAPIPKKVVFALKDGDDVDYDGYAGCWSVKASTKRRPSVIDRKKTPIHAEDDVIYAGCYVNASIDFWVMDNQYGKKVLANLNGVQFYRDGETFGTSSSGADDFDVIESDDVGAAETDADDPFA